MAKDQVRTFLAAPFHKVFGEEFERILEGLRKSYPHQVKWVDPHQVHLTLHFFGAIEKGRLESLKVLFSHLAERFSPMELSLRNVGAFPNLKRPRVIWVGLDGDVQSLKDLKEAIDLELVCLGFPLESREFKPHLTLGRVRENTRIDFKLPSYLEKYECKEKQKIEEIILYQSELTPKGPVYTPLEIFEFKK